jgi:acetyl/propionyl-CoA carboxylase alpha subunit
MHFSKNENQAGMSAVNFHKILIANRGEIALRIIRAIHGLDKQAVVVHSEYDRDLPFVTEADEAYSLGFGGLSDTYLDQEKIIQIAKEARVDAIHPGYGFLAENEEFAAACHGHKISFIGPSSAVIGIMGDKSKAREKARELGLPVLEGVVADPDQLISQREQLPYPVLIKPSAGGGGKGMRVVHAAGEFEEACREATREAKSYFGSGALYVEKYLLNPRHIEVQVMADHHGHSVHMFERECSLQRRHQKIIEEAPSAAISDTTRRKLTESALRLVDGIGYTNAGTVEFLLGPDDAYYFLEMNTRIQVEHPVTEMITGKDLVKEQITIAEGHPLSFAQNELNIIGHSIEARIYAEDPEKDFMPSAGRIETLQHTVGKESRLDSGFIGGNLVEPHYDPMIAKLVVKGNNREEARNNLIGSLKDLHITGLKTNRDFLVSIARSEAFANNRVHTMFIEQEAQSLLVEQIKSREASSKTMMIAAATLIALQSSPSGNGPLNSPWHSIGHWRIVPRIILQQEDRKFQVGYELLKGREKMRLTIDNHDHEVCQEEKQGNQYKIRIDRHVLHIWGTTDRSEILLDMDGHLHSFRRPDILDERYMGSGKSNKGKFTNRIEAPLNGRIVQISCQKGEKVKQGEPLLVIESMKMENKILAPHQALIKNINVSVGEQVHANQLLFTLDSYDTSSDK